MTTREQLSALERESSELREQGRYLPYSEYMRLGDLHTAVRLEERAKAKEKEGAK